MYSLSHFTTLLSKCKHYKHYRSILMLMRPVRTPSVHIGIDTRIDGSAVTVNSDTMFVLHRQAGIVTKATGCRTEGIVFRQQYTDRLWGPPSILTNRYRGFLTRGQSGQSAKLIMLYSPCGPWMILQFLN
jgi:hypothetical protein